ncbi:hypothetical protein ACFQ3F_14350 [Nocardioides ginsengisoli]|uniref:Uncharacterized protein n=1 Tax=Nocardioides ginsengisoli TaxID=363868 RepID=A0ABW3W387_9ACTN
MATWLERFWEGLHVATDSEFRDVTALTDAIEELVSLRSSLHAAEPTRPFGRAVRLAQSMADSAVAMVQRYMGALMAATPLGAQASAEEAQRALDELAQLAGELAGWLERQAKVSEAATVQESLWALVTDSMNAAGAESLLPMAQANLEQLSSHLGIQPELDVAIDYGISSTFADIFLSHEAFQAKLEVAFDVLNADVPELDIMLRDAGFQCDLSRLQLEVFDSGVACQRSLAAALHVRQEARAVVELNASLVEAAGLVLGIPLMTAVGQKSAPYSTLRLKDASDHLRKAQTNDRIATVFAGLDDHLRTAQAHRGVAYGDEALTTDLKSGRREYVYDALVDSTFEAMESVLAGFCALRLACAIRGIDVAGESGLESLGFSPADVADFTFGAFGFPDRVVAVESDCLHVVLGADSMMGVTIAVGATLAAVRGDPFKSVRVELSDGGVWLCQMDLYSAFRAAAGDFEKQVALMRIQAGWRSLDGGTAWASSPVLRKWAATQVTETMSLDTHEKFKRLRLLRAFAEQVGERELETTIRGFVGWARLDLLGQQGGEPERRAVGQILEWATAAVEFDLI